MGIPNRVCSHLALVMTLLYGTATASAFSLVGPFAKWMDATNGFPRGYAIGGPMNIGQGYRWNVPYVTYAFDQSFLDFFGSNGVNAVEGAIAILNRLPRASDIVLTNYPTDTRGFNYQAIDRDLTDLKSVALSVLVEHLGLAAPSQNIYVFRRVNNYVFSYVSHNPDDLDSYTPYWLIKPKFDPVTLAPTDFINGTAYWTLPYGRTNSQNVLFAWMNSYAIDPLAWVPSSVADHSAEGVGLFYKGLTSDDVGGLRYLLRTNTVNYETLLSDVQGVAPPVPPHLPPPRPGDLPPPPPIPYNFVRVAPRPGIEKITFVRQTYNAGLNKTSPMTYRYMDTYVLNGVVQHQLLERVVTQPDILFSTVEPTQGSYWQNFYAHTSASNWWNCAAGSTNADRIGPGVIRPAVTIAFTKLGPSVETWDDFYDYVYHGQRFGSFGGSTNSVVAYPGHPTSTETNRLTVRFWLENQPGTPPGGFKWQVPIPIGGKATLQISTNLTDWESRYTLVNEGIPFDWYHHGFRPQQFFRVVAH